METFHIDILHCILWICQHVMSMSMDFGIFLLLDQKSDLELFTSSKNHELFMNEAA